MNFTKEEQNGKIIWNPINLYKFRNAVFDVENVIKKYDTNFKIPINLRLRYTLNNKPALLTHNKGMWSLQISKEKFDNKEAKDDVKIYLLHELIHYWIGKNFTELDSLEYFELNKIKLICEDCSRSNRYKLYCLFMNHGGENNKERTCNWCQYKSVYCHYNCKFTNYELFEELIVNLSTIKLFNCTLNTTPKLPLDFKNKNYFNNFELNIRKVLGEYLPHLPYALESLFKHFNLKCCSSSTLAGTPYQENPATQP